MSFYGKIYKFEKQENYEQFVEAFGLPEEKKNFFLNYRPNQRFEKDGDLYTHVVYDNDTERPTQFKSGVEFESKINTTPIKNLYIVEGNTITYVGKFGDNGEASTNVKKEFSGNKLVETITSDNHDVTAKRYFSA